MKILLAEEVLRSFTLVKAAMTLKKHFKTVITAIKEKYYQKNWQNKVPNAGKMFVHCANIIYNNNIL